MLKNNPENTTPAEAIALQMLSFLASDGERLAGFMEVSGLTPQSLRGAAGEPDFLAGVMDYLLGDQSLLLAFAEQASIRPEKLVAARRQLPGATL